MEFIRDKRVRTQFKFQLWVKFSDQETHSEDFHALVDHICSCALWGNFAATYFSDDLESNARILVWEFSSVEDLDACVDSSEFQNVKISPVKEITGEDDKVKFTEGFSS